MAQWNVNDAATNSVSWAARSIGAGSGKAAQAANNTALFANNTADAFITGQVIGQFGVDGTEIIAANGGVAHTGWALRREGTGGRAGRVHYEVLVAGGITGDASDDAALPDMTIIFLTQPSNDSANVTASETASFAVTTSTIPSGGSVTYKWQANTGSGFANVNNGAVYSNTTTATLSVDDVTGLDGAQYRVVAFATGAVNATSSAATLTVTS